MSTNRVNIRPVQNKRFENQKNNNHSRESPCMIHLKFLLQPQYMNYSFQKSIYYDEEYGQQRSNTRTGLYKRNNEGRNGYSNVFNISRYQYNPKEFPYSRNNAKFFVIKSNSWENVKLSIDNKIWCSTERGNQILHKAYRENAHVFLFFSVTRSGHFCGMAKMNSPVDYNISLDIWSEKNKWKGKFNVDWIFIKDVPNDKFQTIRLENNENHPVTFSRDAQEIPHEKGIELSEVFLHYGNH